MKRTLAAALLCGTLVLALALTLFLTGVHVNTTSAAVGHEEEEEEEEEVVFSETDINFPYVKETLDSPSMESFDLDSLYQTDARPRQRLWSSGNDDRRLLLLGTVDRVASELKMERAHFSGGSYRLLANGIEMNLYFGDNWKRVSVFQPLARHFRIKEVHVPTSQTVNIILPLKGRLSALATFLAHLRTHVLPHERKLSLTIVYFNDASMAAARSLAETSLSGEAAPFAWRFVAANESAFSRGKGIRVGVAAARLRPPDLVFVCDVDVLALPPFFAQCRANALRRKQVYFPVVFSLYNPRLVHSIYEHSVPPLRDQLVVGADNGYWRDFGFGMFCMYKSDYDSAGGVPELATWGREDLLFYQKFTQFNSTKVVRSLDANLFHLYHAKNCTNIAALSYPSCLKSKASNEGSRVQLGLLLFKLHEGIDIEGILSKRFYYFNWVPILILLNVLLTAIIMYQYLLIKILKN